MQVRHSFLSLIFCLSILTTSARAQSALEQRGDVFYEQMAYIRALAYYRKAIEKDSTNQRVKLKMAESYRKLNDPKNSARWYAQVMEDTIATAEHTLHYAEALSSNGKYELAQRWYERYAKEKGREQRIKNRLRGLATKQTFYRNQAYLTIQELPINSPQSDFAPTFYEEALVFASARNGNGGFAWDNSNYLDLYRVADTEVTPLSSKLNSRYHEGPAVFFDNDTKMLFTRSDYQEKKLGKSQDGVNKLKLFYAEKQEDGQWGKPVLLPFNSPEYSCGHPAIARDTTLYFVSDMPGGFGGTDLYRCTYAEGAWQPPVNVGNILNTEGDEMFPFLYNDQELYFASNGHEGLGGLDVFGVDLSQENNEHITNLGYPINTSMDDFSLIVGPDGRSGYFSSNRQGGVGSDDIYAFTSLQPLLDQPRVEGVVSDQLDGMAVPNATVRLVDETDQTVATSTADRQGKYSFPVKLGNRYQVRASQAGYFEEGARFDTYRSEEGLRWQAHIALLKEQKFSLFGLIAETSSDQPIEGVNVTLVDNMSGRTVLTTTTDVTGTFRHPIAGKKLDDRISYQIQLSKEGYLGKTVTFNDKLSQPGEIKLHNTLDIKLNKLDIGTDLGTLIDIQPIYFDLGKDAIRSDAAQELDKIVRIMKENPSIQIELGSHTDARGSAASNLQLSDQRAKASAHYIISQGISSDRIEGKGYGESQLINRCADGVTCSEEEHQPNRRTEFKVTKF